MIVYPGMIVEAGRKAGMKVPENPDVDGSWKAEDYPHFNVFCNVQLARPLSYWGEHWENAKIIAAIPETEIKTITLESLLSRGLHFAS